MIYRQSLYELIRLMLQNANWGCIFIGKNSHFKIIVSYNYNIMKFILLIDLFLPQEFSFNKTIQANKIKSTKKKQEMVTQKYYKN